MVPKPRFHVSNFGGVINLMMNEQFALEMFDLIRKTEGVSQTLFALTEKIENQFFYMGRLTQRHETEVEAEAEAEVEAEVAA